MKTPEEQHIEELAIAVSRQVQAVINEGWKAIPRDAPELTRAQAYDQISIQFDALGAGFALLAERCRATAETMLETAGG